MNENDASAPCLEHGETLVWSGKPDPLGYAWYQGKAEALHGAILTCLAIYMASLVLSFRSSPIADSLWWAQIGMALGVALMLATALWSLFAPIRHFVEARRTRYALTDRRAVISTGSPLSRRRSFPLESMPFVELTPGGQDQGHVLFANTGAMWNRGPAKDGFIAVSTPQAVERLLRLRRRSVP